MSTDDAAQIVTGRLKPLTIGFDTEDSVTEYSSSGQELEALIGLNRDSYRTGNLETVVKGLEHIRYVDKNDAAVDFIPQLRGAYRSVSQGERDYAELHSDLFIANTKYHFHFDLKKMNRGVTQLTIKDETPVTLPPRETTRRLRTYLDSVAILAHDLKTPLTTIIGYPELIITNLKKIPGWESIGPVQQALRWLERITKRARYLVDNIESHMALAAMEQGRLKVKLDYVNLYSGLLAPIVDLYTEINPNAVFHLEELKAQDQPIYTDQKYVKMIVQNLIDNAIKYGDKPQEIWIWYDAENKILSFRNKGKGIPPEHADRIFLPFEKLDPGSDHSHGFGLYMCRKIAEAMGGTIRHRSEIGQYVQMDLVLSQKTI